MKITRNKNFENKIKSVDVAKVQVVQIIIKGVPNPRERPERKMGHSSTGFHLAQSFEMGGGLKLLRHRHDL